MKKLYLSFVIIITICVSCLTAGAQTYSWSQKANFPGLARYYDAGFSIGQYGFIGCGEDNPYNSQYFDFYKWTQSTNTWSQIADYPGTGVASPVCASIEGYGYVGLGFNVITQQGQTDLWKYDTLSNTWTAMANFPGAGRYDASWFVVGHKLYVIGGSTGGPPYLNDAWVYDAHQNSWSQLNNSPAYQIDNMVAFAIGNHGYIGGGYDDYYSGYTACWQYDTTNDSWTPIANLPGAVFQQPRTFVLGSKAYACIGVDSNAFVAGMGGNAGESGDSNYILQLGYSYDTVTKAWSVFTNMGNVGIERRSGTAFSIGRCGYIGTGQDSLSDMLNSFWQYGPDSVSEQIAVIHTKAYPNPSTGSFNINYDGLVTQQSEFRVIDVNDNVVYTTTFNGSTGTLSYAENSLSNGIYFYQIISNNNVLGSGKLVVTR